MQKTTMRGMTLNGLPGKRRYAWQACLWVVFACVACAQQPVSPAAKSAVTPARLPGLRNFHKVNDHVFRGAQPAAWGYSALAGLGVRTVIDLRGDGVPALLEEKLVRAEGMNYLHIPLNGHRAPSNADMARLLSLLDDSSKWPVFVHCRRGADRTGTVMACYRMTHYHWDNDSALAEAMSFGMSPSQVLMRRYILQFHPDSLPGQKASDNGKIGGAPAVPPAGQALLAVPRLLP